MSAGTFDIIIEQGATFTLPIRIARDAFDFTGYTARASARSGFDRAAANLFDFTITNVVGAVGSLTLECDLTAAQTASLGSTPAATPRLVDIGVWDLEIIAPDTSVERILEGKVTLSRGATL